MPEGSHSAHIFNGRAVVHHNKSNKLMKWREQVAEAYRCSGANYLYDEPIMIRIDFKMLRPKSVSYKKRPYPTTRQMDLDKAIRAIGDALNQVAYDDDSQIVCI